MSLAAIVVPIGLWLLVLRSHDNHQRERWQDTFVALAAGFVFPAVAAIVAYLVLPDFGDAVGAIVYAPLTEEPAKLAVALFVIHRSRRRHDEPTDALFYGAAVGLGFAFSENLIYLASGIDGPTIVARSVGAFGHAVYTGLAASAYQAHERDLRRVLPWLVLVVALHALHNALAVVGLPLLVWFGIYAAEISLFTARFRALARTSPDLLAHLPPPATWLLHLPPPRLPAPLTASELDALPPPPTPAPGPSGLEGLPPPQLPPPLPAPGPAGATRL